MDQPFAHPSAGEQGPTWSPLDEYLWHTCDIIADLVEGRLNQRPRVATSARLAAGERPLAVGPAERHTFRALGNGSYSHSSVFAFGSPTFVIGSMVGNAMVNSSRRRTAEQNAQPRWVVDGGGELTITTNKIYFGHPVYWVELDWTGLDTADLVGPDVFQTSFRNVRDGKQLLIQFRTPWASLLFVLAALTAFPAHPRLLGRGWLPWGFEQRCVDLGRPVRPAPQLVLNRGNG